MVRMIILEYQIGSRTPKSLFLNWLQQTLPDSNITDFNNLYF